MNLFALSLYLLSLSSLSVQTQEHPAWESYFEDEKAIGCFLLYEVDKAQLHYYNPQRSQELFPPASTFKLFNALVGLETGVAADENEMIPWNGRKSRMKAWDKDHTLASAMAVSCLPYYQELARRIGRERMQAHLDKLGYGNQTIGEDIDLFWLDESLRISPADQLKFVNRLRLKKLPLALRSMDIVHKIIVLKSAPDFKSYGKTGWYQDGETNLGWLVGWIEKEGKSAVYVLNCERPRVENDGFGKIRYSIRDKILKEMAW